MSMLFATMMRISNGMPIKAVGGLCSKARLMVFIYRADAARPTKVLRSRAVASP